MFLVFDTGRRLAERLAASKVHAHLNEERRATMTAELNVNIDQDGGIREKSALYLTRKMNLLAHF